MDADMVSVITPVYNLASFLAETIKSVRAQSYENWEHILVDDCSTDNSWQLLKEYSEQDPRLKIIRLSTNSGAAEARNAAIKMAKGRYIAFLDGDDLWEPNKLRIQINYMKENLCCFTYTNYVEIDESNSKTVGIVVSPNRISNIDILKSNQICCSTVVYDTYDVGKVYMPLIRKRQDWGLWIELMRRGLRPENVGESLIRYRVRANSVSSNKFSAIYYVWIFYKQVLGKHPLACTWRTIVYVAINARKYRTKILSARSMNNTATSD